MPFNLFTAIIRFGFDAWELRLKNNAKKYNAMDVYNRNKKLKEKKIILLGTLKVPQTVELMPPFTVTEHFSFCSP